MTRKRTTTLVAKDRHGGANTVRESFFLPHRSDGLGLCVKVHTHLAIEVRGSQERTTRSSERKERQRNRDRNVDTNLTNIDLSLILASSGTAASEQGSTVPVGVAVDESDGLIQSICLEADEHRAKDLLLVAAHLRGHASDDGRGQEVALRVAGHLDATAIQSDGRTLLFSAGDQLLGAAESLRRDHRAEVGSRFVARVGGELGGTLNDVRHPLAALTDKHRRAERHTALTGGTEGGAHQLVDGLLLERVRQDRGVVLGRHVALHALAVRCGALVNVHTGALTTHKAHRADLRRVTDEVHCIVLALDHVHHTLGNASLRGQLHEQSGRAGHALARLQHKGVTAGDCQREHPQRDHGGKVERRHTTDHAERLTVGVGVDVRTNVLHRFAHHHAGCSTSVLNHLQSTEDITTGILKSLSLLSCDHACEALLVLTNQVLVLEHHGLASTNRGLVPSRVRSSRRLDGCLHLL
mmetsp:Transcript_42388/g.106937  ORF Transcript_42388/g.106937 Transcript_42388/m.106937 type:complete len:468 (-) Transcript_42388:382-1785(-)